MKRLALSLGALAAGLAISLFAGQAQAAPITGPSCTGTTTTVGVGGSVLVSFLVNPATGVSTGNCVNAGDKTFGSFSSTGFSNTGSAQYVFGANSVTETFLGALGTGAAAASGTLGFTVAVNPALSNQLIATVQSDFSLQAAPNVNGPANGSLQTNVLIANPGVPITFSCDRTVNPVTSTCPKTQGISPVSAINVSETLNISANGIGTSISNTITQVAAPEPASLGLLGTGLLGLGVLARRRRR